VEGLKNLHQGIERNPIAHVIVIFYPWKMLFFQNLPFKQMLPNYMIFSFYNWVPHFFFLHKYLVEGLYGIHDLIFHWPLFLFNFNISSSIYVAIYTQLHHGP
jgi:hypothetical protein